MDTLVRPNPGPRTSDFRLWMPRQHGAWAMLALPLLLGIAASRPTGWHIVLAGAAVSGYLASTTAQTWARARARERYTAPLLVYAGTAAVLALALVVTHPVLLLALLVLVPAGAITLVATNLGRARGAAASFAQVAQALVLVPAAAALAGPLNSPPVAKATFLAAVYLVGTVLAVRSVIREQGNAGFAAISVGFHVAATGVGAVLLPPPFVTLLGVLTIRAALLPIVQARRRGTANPLRPIHVGMLEMVLATCVVGLAFVAPI